MRRIRVLAYSGCKADERPLSFFLGGEKIPVETILRQWVEEDSELRMGRRSCFLVRGEDTKTYCLCHHHKEGAWFLAKNP